MTEDTKNPKIVIPSLTNAYDGWVEWDYDEAITVEELPVLEGFIKEINLVLPAALTSMYNMQATLAEKLKTDCEESALLVHPAIEFHKEPFVIQLLSDGLNILYREIPVQYTEENHWIVRGSLKCLGTIHSDYVERCGKDVQKWFEGSTTEEQMQKRKFQYSHR